VSKVRATITDANCKLTQKEMVRLITELTDEISAASISHWKKDDLRTELKNLKKAIDDKDRAR